jgi:hypothetical protein
MSTVHVNVHEYDDNIRFYIIIYIIIIGQRTTDKHEMSHPPRTINMPEQFGSASGDTLFALNRAAYLRTAGSVGIDNQNYNALLNKKTKIFTSTDSSSYIQSRRIHSIGFSSTRAPLGDILTFKNPDIQVQKEAIRRCRSGGCIAPAKKGANTSFHSGK